jgi:hypothetical protein
LAILKFEARLEQGLGLKVPDGGQLPLQHHVHGGLVLRQALPPNHSMLLTPCKAFSARQQGERIQLITFNPAMLAARRTLSVFLLLAKVQNC